LPEIVKDCRILLQSRSAGSDLGAKMLTVLGSTVL